MFEMWFPTCNKFPAPAAYVARGDMDIYQLGPPASYFSLLEHAAEVLETEDNQHKRGWEEIPGCFMKSENIYSTDSIISL